LKYSISSDLKLSIFISLLTQIQAKAHQDIAVSQTAAAGTEEAMELIVIIFFTAVTTDLIFTTIIHFYHHN